MVVLRVVGLAIHAIALASCNKFIYYLQLASKRQNFYALKPNTWGSYTYSSAQYSALPCDVALVKIMTPKVKSHLSMKGLAQKRTEK